MSFAAVNLSFGYGARTVGRNVTLALAGGEALALLGPNGGGKTTLLKTLLGLLKPQAGEVMLDGLSVAAYSISERAQRLAYVPQSHGSAFAFTAFDVVLMGRTARQGLFASPSAKDREVSRAMLERLGVPHLAERPHTMISGGERQLVLLARALAQEPRYIVLDEPTASLDFGNQGKTMSQIRRLAQDGHGVIFTTHDPNQALRYADRVALLGEGRLLALGTPREILSGAQLRSLYSAEIETISAADGRVAFLPG